MSIRRSHTHSWRARAAAAAAVGVVAAGLAACTPENIAERIIESGNEGVGDVEFGDDGQVTIGGDDGDVMSFGGGEIPDGFPSSIPLVDGDITFAGSFSDEQGRSYQVMMAVPGGDVGDLFSQLKDDFSGAGLELTSESTSSSGDAVYSTASFESAEWEVILSVNTDPSTGDPIVSYLLDEVQE